MKKLALALGGGGARGLAHIGFLRVIEKEKIPIARISGCSMGAMVGGIYCYHANVEALEDMAYRFVKHPLFKDFNFDDFASLEDTADDFSEKAIFMMSKLKVAIALFKTLAKSSIYDEALVEKVYSLFPDDKIQNLNIPFAAVSNDLITGQEILLNTGSLRLAIRASSSIPGYFPPVKYNKFLLVDGGVSNVIPTSYFRKKRNEIIVGVNVGQDIRANADLKSGINIMVRAEMIRSYHLTQFKTANADQIVNCDLGKLSWADFRKSEEIIKAGETAARNFLPWLEKNL